MSYRLPSAIFIAALGVLGTSGCTTLSGPQGQVFYEVPCHMPGAFRAQLAPAQSAPPPPPPAAAAGEAAAPPPPIGVPGAAYEPGYGSICLASAATLPGGYRGTAYGYYDNYWRPYRGYGFFGLGIGLGHGRHHGGRHGGGHHGGGHHSGGHHRGHR